MATVINATEPYAPIEGRKTIFLAGTIQKDDAWRVFVIEELRSLPVAILNPNQPKWDRTWKQDISDERFAEQVSWEQDMLAQADVVAVYLGPETAAPISMLELGVAVGSGKQVVVACPESEFARRGNLQVLEKKSRGSVILVDRVAKLAKELQLILNRA